MSEPRRVHVALQPPPGESLRGHTLIVIDTLRATTVLTTLIAGGAARVYPCAGIDAARALRGQLPAARLCGESGGLPPEGFDYGNSPTEFHALDVRGWTLIQATSNGTRALARAADATRTHVACLRNRDAAARAALHDPEPVTIVCSGEHDGQRPSLEDTFSAGALVERLLQIEPGCVLDSGALIALQLFASYDRDPAAAFAAAPHAGNLRALHFDADLAFAAALDVEDCVPRAGLDPEGRVVVASPDSP